MGKETAISWADATVNFWHGCKKVSKGCKFCHMYREKSRFGQKGDIVTRSSKQKFFEALRWQDGKLIFTCDWSDFFIKEADEIMDETGKIVLSHWRKEAWEVIKNTPQHTWIILTKRPERILQCLPPDWGPKGYPNVWLGVSVESQKTAHNRIMELFKVRCAVRVVSAEPLLEKIDLTPYLKVQLGPKEWVYPIHWVIAGGESGNNEGEFKYRPCRAEWLHDIVKQCKAQEVPVFIKQLGTSISKQMELKDRHGADLSEPAFPGYLKLQEFPKILQI
jgi:protein gp37